MDGAGGLARLWHITLPMIRRSISTNLMLITLQTLSVFGLIWVMTRGGPGNKSQTLPLFMYEQAFKKRMLGYGTAVALLLLRGRRAVLAGLPALLRRRSDDRGTRTPSPRANVGRAGTATAAQPPPTGRRRRAAGRRRAAFVAPARVAGPGVARPEADAAGAAPRRPRPWTTSTRC